MLINKRETSIREYAEGMEVGIADWQLVEMGASLPTGEVRLVIEALNEGGHNGTHVDLRDVIAWVKANKPELLLEEIENV